MEFPQGVEKRACLAQDSRRQQIGLRVKGPRLQPPVFALTHDPLHVFVRDLEILQQRAFELIAALGILRHGLHPLQREPDMAALDHLPE
jgi:hypothetical protein